MKSFEMFQMSSWVDRGILTKQIESSNSYVKRVISKSHLLIGGVFVAVNIALAGMGPVEINLYPSSFATISTAASESSASKINDFMPDSYLDALSKSMKSFKTVNELETGIDIDFFA